MNDYLKVKLLDYIKVLEDDYDRYSSLYCENKSDFYNGMRHSTLATINELKKILAGL